MATSSPTPTATYAPRPAFPTSQSIATRNSVLPNARLSPTAAAGLDLELGMCAGLTGTQQANPPAWLGTYGGQPDLAPLRVGMMRNSPGSLPGAPYVLYFIFNPSQIDVTFSTNTNAYPAAAYWAGGSSKVVKSLTSPSQTGFGAGGGVVPSLVAQQNVSWSLMFDRTYDMMYGPNPQDQRGVLHDVAQLYALLGTYESVGAVPFSTPVQVIFGQTGTGAIWGFTGFVSEVTITYGIMRNNMIPSRCEVDISMMATYIGTQVPPSDNAPPSGNAGLIGTGSGSALAGSGPPTVTRTRP